MPPPYDVHNFLDLLGIEILDERSDDAVGRLTVRHDLIAGTGYLWAPVVVALADALCAFGVGRNWPPEATSFTTIEAKANFLASAKEGELVVGRAIPSISGAPLRSGMPPLPTRPPGDPWPPIGARSSSSIRSGLQR